MRTFSDGDTIKLLCDLPHLGLVVGQEGTIEQEMEPGIFFCSFVMSDGVTVVSIGLQNILIDLAEEDILP